MKAAIVLLVIFSLNYFVSSSLSHSPNGNKEASNRQQLSPKKQQKSIESLYQKDSEKNLAPSLSNPDVEWRSLLLVGDEMDLKTRASYCKVLTKIT